MKRYNRIRFEHFIIAMLLFQVIINFIYINRIGNINPDILEVAYDGLGVYHKWISNGILFLFIWFMIGRHTLPNKCEICGGEKVAQEGDK